jgi:hypothetical protein
VAKSAVKSSGGFPFQTALFSVVLAVVIHAPTMLIWFVKRMFIMLLFLLTEFA